MRESEQMMRQVETWRMFREGLCEDKTEGPKGPERARKVEPMLQKLESDAFHTWLVRSVSIEALTFPRAKRKTMGCCTSSMPAIGHDMRPISVLCGRIPRHWANET